MLALRCQALLLDLDGTLVDSAGRIRRLWHQWGQRRGIAAEGYLLAAQRLALRPNDCVVIEDAPAGVKAGKAAGMRVVALANTHSPEALTDADAISPALAQIDVSVTGGEIVVRI